MMFLLVVTVTSMVLAAIMGIIAWRIAVSERRRSEARIAALAAEIRDVVPPRAIAPAEPAWTRDLELRPGTPLFAARAAAHGPRPLAVIGGGAFVFAALVSIGVVAPGWVSRTDGSGPAQAGLHDGKAALDGDSAALHDGRAALHDAEAALDGDRAALHGDSAALNDAADARNVHDSAQRSVRDTSPWGPASAGPAQRPASQPLELVALGHERVGDHLTVRGVIRNPPSGAGMDRLTAVVFLYGADGGFLASGRAPVDTPALGPGGETAFSVTLPRAAAAGRYRVSFRTDDRLVPHVDRRHEQS